MALIGVENAIKHALSLLKSSPALHGIQILSYKRNRYVSISRNDCAFLVEEKGYVENTQVSEADDLPRLLKTIFKREFPRSRKVRIIRLENDNCARKNLKKL